MPFNLGGPEVLIILVIVLVVFGAGKLPHVMKDVGAGLREFKRAQTDEAPSPIPPAPAATDRVAVAPAPGAETSPDQAASRAPRA